MRPFYEQRELALMRFQFMEKRFTIVETLKWLDGYRDTVIMAEEHRRSVHDAMIVEMTNYGTLSVHQQLMLESILMELTTLRTWIDNARTRLAMVLHQTGEFNTINDKSDRPDSP